MVAIVFVVFLVYYCLRSGGHCLCGFLCLLFAQALMAIVFVIVIVCIFLGLNQHCFHGFGF
jgi:hypothetical protein